LCVATLVLSRILFPGQALTDIVLVLKSKAFIILVANFSAFAIGNEIVDTYEIKVIVLI
jgi:hypothetical protein